MTNCPEPTRKIWTDLYKLFDIHYKMPNTDEAWKSYWDDGRKIYEQSHENPRVMDALTIISEVFADRMKADAKEHQISMTEV